MRVVSYRSERGVRAGLLRDDSVVDIWDALGGDGFSVRELLASGRLAEAAEISGGEPLGLERVELAPPVPDPARSSASGSTTAPTQPRRESIFRSRRPSSPSSATR